METGKLYEYGITSGILGAECALGLQGYCMFRAQSFPIFLYGGNKRMDLFPGVHPMGPEVREDEMVPYKNGLMMTTPERSLIDLIREYPESEFIPEGLECLDNYDKLYELADRYNMRSEVDWQIEHMHDCDD